mgnify:CR=1 FL=1
MTSQIIKLSFNKQALVGLVLLAPTVFFISLALSKYALGINYFFDAFDSFISEPTRFKVFNTISPIIFLGGSLLALGINLWAVAGIKIKKENSNLVSTLIIKSNFWNLAVIFVSFMVVTMLVGYVIGENWQCWVGLKVKC